LLASFGKASFLSSIDNLRNPTKQNFGTACFSYESIQSDQMKIIEKYKLDEEQIDRIVGMAWEDRTTFEAIETQFGLSEGEVIKLMRHQMTLKNWQKWRAHVQGRKTKHQKLREGDVKRFKSKAQKMIAKNRIPKAK
jgi:uncharacterized protein (TIGR03643 family)